MIRYFIINNASRASNYGVGTYNKQLISCLAPESEVKIAMIDFDADAKEYSIIEDEFGYTHYMIPRVNGVSKYDVYCRNAFYFLAQQIGKCENESIIFHFNFFLHYDLAIRLKAYLPESKVIIAVHYLSWCFDLNGNITKFRHYIHGDYSRSYQYVKEEQYGKIDRSYRNTIDSYNTERKFMKLADAVVVLSERTKDVIVKDYQISKDKIRVIQNGLEETISETSLKEPHAIPTGQKKNILFVGRLDNIKGVRYLIKAFKTLYEEDSSLHLYLIGDGDFSSHLSDAKGIWEAVTFTGKTNKTDAELYYNQATIGVLPSFHEQCSYTAIEMMMHGIPLVGTDSTGLCEMLDYTPENIVHIEEEAFDADAFVAELSQKMKRLLYDHDYHRKSSLLMRQTYLDRYTIDLMRTKYNGLLDELKGEQKVLSDDIITMLDYQMFSLINDRPEIDLSFFGMTGVGYYLWRRVTLLNGSQGIKDQSLSLKIQEYLIYYLDWVIDEISNLTVQEREQLELEKLQLFIVELNNSGFYKMGVRRIIKMLGMDACLARKNVRTEEIYANALKIYNYGA